MFAPSGVFAGITGLPVGLHRINYISQYHRMKKYKLLHRRINSKSLILFFFFLLLSILPFYRIFSVRFVDGHDFLLHIERMYVLEQSVRNGVMLPRWLPEALYGYGSPLFSVYWGVPYYIAVFFRLTGLSYETTYKLVLLLPNILSFFGMYLWIQSKWKSRSIAFLSALVYLFTPYRFLDTLIRSALGELYFFAFLPFVFYSLDSPLKPRSYIIGSIALALAIYSHHGLAFFSFLIIGLYAGVQFAVKRQLPVFAAQCKMIATGLLLSAFFWIPAIAYEHYLGNYQKSISGLWFPPPISLLRSAWEGGYIHGERLIMSYEIGLPQIGILFLGIIFLIVSILRKRISLALLFWMGVCLISIFFMLPVSRWFWIHIPFIANIQFPFRLLFVPMLICPIVLATLIKSIPHHRIRFLFGILIIIGFIYANRNHLGVLNTYFDIQSLKSYRGSFDVGGECTPSYMDIKKIEEDNLSRKNQSEFTIVDGSGNIHSQSRSPLRSTANIDMKTGGIVVIHRTYFPGWTITVNGFPNQPVSTKNGISISLLPGTSDVNILYRDTLLENISTAISIFTALFLILSNESCKLELSKYITLTFHSKAQSTLHLKKGM